MAAHISFAFPRILTWQDHAHLVRDGDISLYNGFGELDTPHFGVENNFRKDDPEWGVGWVLIAMDVKIICDIDRNKSNKKIRKNKNFEISECWNAISPQWTSF